MVSGTLKMRLEESDAELFKLKDSFNLHYCTKIISTRDIFVMKKMVHIVQGEWT